jgi:hypothetical protein
MVTPWIQLTPHIWTYLNSVNQLLVAHVFPDIANNSLISVGHLCNEGSYVTFNIDRVTIFNSASKAIQKGLRDLGTGLWRINLRTDKPHTKIAQANNIYEL